MCNDAVKYYNPVTNLCMLRCGTEEYRQVNALLHTSHMQSEMHRKAPQLITGVVRCEHDQ